MIMCGHTLRTRIPKGTWNLIEDTSKFIREFGIPFLLYRNLSNVMEINYFFTIFVNYTNNLQ